ncbi:MAG: ECF transporter S component [Clostridia bacterium]|nr:ECF transporter S component [Clostridia bacterium]
MKEAGGQKLRRFLHIFLRKRSRLFMQKKTYRLVVTAMLLALGMVLPFLTGQIPAVGQMISPLHIPAFICGLLCGWQWGLALGVVLPLLRSVVFGMPPLVAVAIPMAFELAVYGAVCGLLYPRLQAKMKRLPAMLIALIIAMVLGRIAGGAVKAVVMGLTGGSYTFAAFVAGYFTSTLAGAGIHLVLVPAIVAGVEKISK